MNTTVFSTSTNDERNDALVLAKALVHPEKEERDKSLALLKHTLVPIAIKASTTETAKGKNKKANKASKELSTDDQSGVRTVLWAFSAKDYADASSEAKDLEIMKLWKALYYALWLADKVPVQNELAENLVDIMFIWTDSEERFRYLRALLRILMREWQNLDYYRVNKFYTLLKLAIRKSIQWIVSANYNQELVETFFELLTAEVLRKKPNGPRYHVLDIYLEEIHNVTTASNHNISSKHFMQLLQPFFHAAVAADELTYVERVHKAILTGFIDTYARETANSENSEDKVTVFSEVNTQLMQKKIFDLAAEETTPDKYRQHLYEIHKVYSKKTGVRFIEMKDLAEDEQVAQDEELLALVSTEDEREAFHQLLQQQSQVDKSNKKSKKVDASAAGKKKKAAMEVDEDEEAPQLVPMDEVPAASKTNTTANKNENSNKKNKKRKQAETEEVVVEEPVVVEPEVVEAPKKKNKQKKPEPEIVNAEPEPEVVEQPAAKKVKANKKAKVEEESAPAPVVEESANAAPAAFIASRTFSGKKEGYVFRNGKSSLGYYLDAKEQKKLTRSDEVKESKNKVTWSKKLVATKSIPRKSK